MPGTGGDEAEVPDRPVVGGFGQAFRTDLAFGPSPTVKEFGPDRASTEAAEDGIGRPEREASSCSIWSPASSASAASHSGRGRLVSHSKPTDRAKAGPDRRRRRLANRKMKPTRLSSG